MATSNPDDSDAALALAALAMTATIARRALLAIYHREHVDPLALPRHPTIVVIRYIDALEFAIAEFDRAAAEPFAA